MNKTGIVLKEYSVILLVSCAETNIQISPVTVNLSIRRTHVGGLGRVESTSNVNKLNPSHCRAQKFVLCHHGGLLRREGDYQQASPNVSVLQAIIMSSLNGFTW